MHVLVTGGTGFIGSHLIPRLLSRGDRVRALVRGTTEPPALPNLGVEVVRGDLRDRNAVQRAIGGCQVVYHLAKAPSGSGKTTLEQINVGGTMNVVQSAAWAGVERLVHCSSTAVYGHNSKEKLPLSEETPTCPDSAYARSKAVGEKAVQSYADRLPVVVARITSVLGPRSLGWLGFFRSIATHRLRLIGSGTGSQHLVDVSDVVDGLIRCATTPAAVGRTYIIAGPETVRLREMVRLIMEEVNACGWVPRTLPASPFRVYLLLNDMVGGLLSISLPRAEGVAFLMSNRILDISRARRELDYAPKVGIRETIHRTAQWYRTEGYLGSRS